MKTALCLVLPLVSAALVVTAAPAPLPRKLIMTGWDNPDTAQFQREVRSMEQWPFDGAVMDRVNRAALGPGCLGTTLQVTQIVQVERHGRTLTINGKVHREDGFVFCGMAYVRDHPFGYKHGCAPDGDFVTCPVQFCGEGLNEARLRSPSS